MNRLRIVSLVIGLAYLSAACASNQPAAPTSQPVSSPTQTTSPAGVTPVSTEPTSPTEPPTETVVSAASTASPTTPAGQPEPTASGRDFTQINVCSLVSDQEVAQLDKGSVQSPSQNSDLGTTRGCSYSIQTADGGYDNVIIYVEPPDLLEASLDLSDDKGTPIANLGDQAYLQKDVDAGQFRLLAERKGDFGIEVIGENGDALVEIARLLLTRIQ